MEGQFEMNKEFYQKYIEEDFEAIMEMANMNGMEVHLDGEKK
jgi:hypothetical protein